MIWSRQKHDGLSTLFESRYKVDARLRPASIRRYRSELNRLDRLLGPVPIPDFRVNHFDNFRNAALEAGLQPETIESSIKVAKAILRYARDRGIIKAIPLFGKPLRITAPEPEPATHDEIEALWSVFKLANYPGRGRLSPCDWWKAWSTIDFFTALRIEDSMRLAKEHVRSDHIRFQASKTSAVHLFPLVSPVSDWTEELFKSDSPLLFGRHRQNGLRDEMARLCELAAIRRLTPKCFRQAGITAWVKADETAGKLVHGCGLPGVLHHYIGVVDVLRSALDRFVWPACMLHPGRSRRLF